MKSPFYFITKPLNGGRYNNTKSIGGIDMIVSTSEEDHAFSNREAVVVELPIGYDGDVVVGDILLVHHNVFKFYNDVRGNRRSGKSFFKEDLFFIDSEQFFMYQHDGVWHPYDRYCFVSSVPASDCYIKKPFSEEPLMGVMEYPNKYLSSKGVNKGDVVCYTPNSQYEFLVDGVKMYRIFDHQITLKV